jgi:hypothetical protein
MPQLSDFSNAKLQHAEIAALARLHLYFTARTHELIGDFSKRAGARVIAASGKDGMLDMTEAFRAQQSITGWWSDVMGEWTKELQKARGVAAMLPFGWMSEIHQRLVFSTPVAESRGLDTPMGTSATRPAGSMMLEAAKVNQGVFEPQLETLVNSAAEYLYGDGLNLSQRIWQVTNDAQNEMNTLILNAVQNGTSAYDLAQQLEVFLGASQDCPRWTSTRLYNMTKKDIAGGDLRGLVSGDACDGRGVAYNALRLARTEIQKIHALATDRVLANSPWVEMEQTNLSGGHVEPDECDDVVKGGEKGDGVYPVGTIEYPLHPNCLCYKTAVLMDEDAFISSLAAWTKGEQEWAAMDSYAEMLGSDQSSVSSVDLSKEPALLMLGVWMFSQGLKL